MKLGDFEIQTVSGGSFRLDGGAMFGVVPKPMWERQSPADQLNRIKLATNCLLVRTPSQTMLIDTGYGSKLPKKQLGHIAGEDGNPLVESLSRTGISREQVDAVIFTHLHFDHAGGATMFDEAGKLVPVFPNARHIVQQIEWNDATSDRPELAGSYETAELLVLQQSGLLETVESDHEIFAGISVHRTGGHTAGHQIVKLESFGQRAAYLGDICPTVAHLKTFWTMSYDQFPMDTRRVKPQILQSMVNDDSLLLFDHDPRIKAARIEPDDNGNIVIREAIDL